jgi:hypothetical protein
MMSTEERMPAKPVEILSGKLAAERGALIAAAGALVVLAATAAWRPDFLVRLLGPDPAPQLLAVLSLFATLPAGGEMGRRAIHLRKAAEGRRLHLLVWTFVAYLASLTVGTAALTFADDGPGALADPFALVARGLAVSLLLLPWAALPIAGTAMALERWTRPSVERRLGPGGGPGPGTREPLPRAPPADARRGRSAA